MKVLHVITYLSDGGGAEKLLEDLLPTMKEQGVDVSVAVLKDIDTNNKKNLLANGIKIIPVGSGSRLYSPIKMFRLISIMRQYDVVHTHLTPPFLMGAFNKRFCKAKFVYTIHNTDFRSRHIPVLRQIEKLALRQYDSIICCSEDAEIQLRKFWGKNRTNIVTINNGIKLEKFKNAHPLPEMEEQPYKKITMVAVFRPQKDHETLIRAAKLLPEDFHVYFVGYGELKGKMEQLSQELGVSDRIHFLGKRNDVPQILKASDYIVLSSHYEGLSLASIEGMSVGKPFIASDVKGLRELVADYGILFNEGDYVDLSKQIIALDDDKDLYKKVSEKCVSRSESFGINCMSKKYIELY